MPEAAKNLHKATKARAFALQDRASFLRFRAFSTLPGADSLQGIFSPERVIHDNTSGTYERRHRTP
jgi:hypothetical protein